MKRVLIFVALLSLSSMALAPAALAAEAATNDFWPGTTITSLPFSETIDTTAATTDGDDTAANDPDLCGAPATDASVWYQYTPAADEIVIAETSGYSSGFIVVSGTQGSFVFEACRQWEVAFFAQAGVTYSMVAIDDQLDEDGFNGGELTVNVYNAPPPPTVDITVNPTAKFHADGSATVSGTVTCTGDAYDTWIEVSLTQPVGRLLTVRGYGGASFACDGTTQAWIATVYGDNGLFKGGKAFARVWAYACGNDCAEAYVEQNLSLKK